MQLKPYQQVAADRISKSYQLIIADEMGLGKTAELLRGLWPTFVSYRTRKILVVCPASLKWNWVREIKQWFGLCHIPSAKQKRATFYIQIGGKENGA